MDQLTSSLATFYYRNENNKPIDVRDDLNTTLGLNKYQMLSPEQLNRSRSATITNTTTNANTNLIWTDAQVSDFSTSFFVDTSEIPVADQGNRNASTVVKTMIERLWIPRNNKDGAQQRPRVIFVFGKFNFEGLLSKFDEKYTYFSSKGFPLRAEISISMKRLLSEKKSQSDIPKSKSRSVRVVKAGDRLDLMANDYYGDPALWREIARENNIASPRRFPEASDLGREILLPDIFLGR